MKTVFRVCAFLLSLAGFLEAQQWRLLGSSAVPTRHGHAMVHDAARGRTVLFGGYSAAGLRGDTWEFDGVAWTPVSTATSPAPRGGHALAYDTARRRIVLFGGSVRTGLVADTWEYDGSSWTPISTATTPSARASHALAYDMARRRTVLFGGYSNGSGVGDTWEYDGTDWTRITIAAPPTPRNGHALAYDTARGRVVLFGGSTVQSTYSADTWEYDGSSWTPISTATTPSGRTEHVLAYDVARGRTVLFGGVLSCHHFVCVCLADAWEYDGSAWTLIGIAPVTPRADPALAYDVARGRTVLFGGKCWQAGELNDTAELVSAAVATWTRHGLGCAGTSGTPALDALPGSLPGLGGPFTLRLSSLPARPGVALLAFGFDVVQWNSAMLPIELGPFGLPGCGLWIAPAPGLRVFLAHPGNATSFTLMVPADPALAGLVAGTQALLFDAAAPSGLDSVTNGGILRVY